MPPPRGGGRLLSNLNDNSRAETALSQEFSQANQKGANNAQNRADLTSQEQLLAGTLELDPENDPVVYTTDYGLEIKFHNLGTPTQTIIKQADGESTTVSLNGYQYITAGGYNWVIIGQYASSDYRDILFQDKEDIYSKFIHSEDSPAGLAINADENIVYRSITTDPLPIFSNAVVPDNGEIPWGCVLCLCESYVAQMSFGSLANYASSNLLTYINNTVYGGTNTLSVSLQALPIVPQTLKTLWYSGTSTIENAYIFPLAGRDKTESFYVGTYLNNSALRDIDVPWWLRSGASSYNRTAMAVNMSGTVYQSDSYYDCSTTALRPAFVLQLYSA